MRKELFDGDVYKEVIEIAKGMLQKCGNRAFRIRNRRIKITTAGSPKPYSILIDHFKQLDYWNNFLSYQPAVNAAVLPG